MKELAAKLGLTEEEVDFRIWKAIYDSGITTPVHAHEVKDRIIEALIS